MPIEMGEWESIHKLVEDYFRQNGNSIVSGTVLKNDEMRRQVFIKEFGDLPIPVLVSANHMFVYANGQRKLVEIPAAVPKPGETVLLAKLGTTVCCVGKIPNKDEATTPPLISTLSPSAVGLRELSPYCFPSHIDIDVFMTAVSHVNWNTIWMDGGNVHGAQKESSGAQNDEINFDVLLGAGDWTFELMHNRWTSRGIYTVSLSIAGTTLGTIDGYNGSSSYNTKSTLTFTLTENRQERLKLKMATKNASSGSYQGSINHIQLRRTSIGGGAGAGEGS